MLKDFGRSLDEVVEQAKLRTKTRVAVPAK
jgi:hypothetical protein